MTAFKIAICYSKGLHHTLFGTRKPDANFIQPVFLRGWSGLCSLPLITNDMVTTTVEPPLIASHSTSASKGLDWFYTF